MEEDIIELSSSEEECKPFGSRSRKREINSESDDEYVPSPPKKKKAISAAKPKKRQTTPKQVKPRAPKRSTKKPKVEVKVEDNKSEPPLEGEGEGEDGSQKKEGESSQKAVPKGNDFKGAVGMDWSEAEFVSWHELIDIRIACNVLRLFDEDNTIPFIARYRKELTDDMSPEKLRDVKETYEMAKSVKHKASLVMKNIEKVGKLTPVLEQSIRCARTISELDHIYSPFKPGSKHTLAERARLLGLDEPANAILNGSKYVYPEQLVNPAEKGLDSINNVELGLMHIIADVISKDKDLLDLLRKLKEDAHVRLISSKAKATKDKAKEKAKTVKKEEVKGVKKEGRGSQGFKDNVDVESKFENYFQFSIPTKFVKPHQVLALNRGENLKVLSVKLDIPDWVLNRLRDFCRKNWLFKGLRFPLRLKLIENSIVDAYSRLIQPLLVRQIRTELTRKAEHAAVEVFATNLKKLLLSPPFRGKNVLGIDPGYRNGCKIGVTSHTGSILSTDVIYPVFGKDVPPHLDPNAQKLKELLVKYRCEVIALGNGTACRETETYLSDLIQKRWFAPLDVKFTIVSEQGASIYSCSPVAQKEFPGMDPNVISAVSLARRLQDPLGELVKVEPKHLGVGMYQHDVPEKQLNSTLDEVVIECVSFVGVDVNTASDCLLRRIAGLNSSRAQKIIDWRSTNGPLINRQQLKKIKGIGAKTFEQCAGFIRIIPETSKVRDKNESESIPAKKSKLSDESENPLDRTWIHPESYSTAMRFIGKCEVHLEDLGKPHFINKVSSRVQAAGLKTLADEFGVSEATMKLISEGLQQTPDHDLRSKFQEPLFRRGVTSFEDLQIGAILTGRAQNVTHFGIFVDIGVGQDGLIPQSRLRNIIPQLGDRVEVRVFSVDIKRRRIALEVVRIL